MSFHPGSQAYHCNLSGCPVAYTLDKGYYRVSDEGDEFARENFCAHAAICLCESDDLHPMYIQDYSASRKVRFWACPESGCGYEVSQRLEKTTDGWRTCGFFEHTKPVRLRH